MEHSINSHERKRLYTVTIRTNDKKIRELGAHFDRVTIADKEENVIFVGIKILQADNRVDAERKAYHWYWNHCRACFGHAERVITVSDEDEEVRYSNSFSCTDLQARYLDRKTAERLVAESKDELGIRVPDAAEGCAYWQLYRLKKRRNTPSMHKVAPCILKGGSGVLYYRRTLEPQMSANGQVIVRRKMENVRLQARTLKEAYREVIERRLRDIHRTGRRHLAQARQYERFLPPGLLLPAPPRELAPIQAHP